MPKRSTRALAARLATAAARCLPIPSAIAAGATVAASATAAARLTIRVLIGLVLLDLTLIRSAKLELCARDRGTAPVSRRSGVGTPWRNAPAGGNPPGRTPGGPSTADGRSARRRCAVAPRAGRN